MPTIITKTEKRMNTVRIQRMDEYERVVYGEVYALIAWTPTASS